MPYDYQNGLSPADCKFFRDAPEDFILEVNQIYVRLSICSYLSSGQTLHQILFFKSAYVAGFTEKRFSHPGLETICPRGKNKK